MGIDVHDIYNFQKLMKKSFFAQHYFQLCQMRWYLIEYHKNIRLSLWDGWIAKNKAVEGNRFYFILIFKIFYIIIK